MDAITSSIRSTNHFKVVGFVESTFLFKQPSPYKYAKSDILCTTTTWSSHRKVGISLFKNNSSIVWRNAIFYKIQIFDVLSGTDSWPDSILRHGDAPFKVYYIAEAERKHNLHRGLSTHMQNRPDVT